MHPTIRRPAVNFDETPFIVIWETTQACDLACVHCRAKAQPNASPDQLTTAEGLALIDRVAAMGTPIFVLSGGDPLSRPDLLELIRHGKARSLRMATIPAATPRLTREAVHALKDAGLDQMALSLDASTAEAHDRFRGVPGAFEKTMAAAAWAHDAGLPLQINTVMTAQNVDDIDRLVALVGRLGVVFWEVFFLVPVGRGVCVTGLTAEQYEAVFTKLYAAERAAPFIIKVTEALHYRRFRAQQAMAQQAAASGAAPRWSEHGPGGSIGVAPHTVNAGKGHLFISHTGEVFPSGFLPLSAGTIRETDLATLYRTAPLFRMLRNPNALKGRCGCCEFRSFCGGSRSRAYAMTGDYLAEDPCCGYQPVGE